MMTSPCRTAKSKMLVIKCDLVVRVPADSYNGLIGLPALMVSGP